MLRQVTAVAVAVVILGALATPAVWAAEQSSQEPYATEKKESTVDKMERAANSAIEKGKDASKAAVKELSDSWITLKTKLSLLADDRVSSRDVHVTTKQRMVALRGKVESEEARKAAEEDVTKIEGVRGVENHLIVHNELSLEKPQE